MTTEGNDMLSTARAHYQALQRSYDPENEYDSDLVGYVFHDADRLIEALEVANAQLIEENRLVRAERDHYKAQVNGLWDTASRAVSERVRLERLMYGQEE